ncbi:MAG: M20/M25/M40 family metallo-hydrolase, partial [Bulleidia sp.]
MKFDLSRRYCWYFNELSKIPRPSRHEAAAAAYVKAFAEHHHLECWQDEWGNTIIYKAGSQGREKEEMVMLQGHLDMVPACAPGVRHDWEKDPLSLKVEGDYLMADGTTLGADDGVAIAYMLAILEDDSLAHPPLECVFTVMEEIGLEGALHLKPENIRSRRVISLDGGSETSTMCCAAGGIKGAIHVPVKREAYSGTGMKVSFTGCLGGHSGIEIDREHANPILLLARFLSELQEQKIPFRLHSWKGGAADNSIPQDSELLLVSQEPEKVRAVFEKFHAEVFTEYGPTDPGMNLTMEPCEASGSALEEESDQRLIALMNLIPDGVTQRNLALDIPATSDNVGTMELKESEAVILFR